MPPGVSVNSHCKPFRFQSTSLPSGLYRQVNRSSQRASRWTFPLVMSLDGSHMAIVKRLTVANHTHTWWYNRGTSSLFWTVVDADQRDLISGAPAGPHLALRHRHGNGGTSVSDAQVGGVFRTFRWVLTSALPLWMLGSNIVIVSVLLMIDYTVHSTKL